MRLVIGKNPIDGKIYDDNGNDISAQLHVSHVDIFIDAKTGDNVAVLACAFPQLDIEPNKIVLASAEESHEGIYAWYLSCGRMGHLEGIMILTNEEYTKLKDREIYFGEVLGKHSDIYGTPEILLKCNIPSIVLALKLIFGGKVISGLDLFEYISEDEEDV